jgi:glycosyltransferase involved in cell wall biosynthesis
MKIRVLEVLATLKRAGAERMAVSLACGLPRDRFEVRVVSLYDAFPGGFEEVLGEAGVAVTHLGKRRGFDPRMFPRLLRCLRAFQPHGIHSHSYVLRYAFPAGRWARVPALVHTVHNVALQETDRLGRTVNRLAYRAGVLPVAVGAEVARSFQAHYGFAPAAIIRNGIDLEPYRKPVDATAWKRSHGIPEPSRLAVTVCRLEAQKAPVTLLEAFSAALGPHPEWHLAWAGDGSLRADAEEASRRLGLAGRTHFLGSVSDVPSLLQAADLFLLSSLWEGTPMAVMEAQAAGLPVVATNVGGIPEIVEDGVTGLLVTPGDAKPLSHAIRVLALDAAQRERFAGEARARSVRFGATAMVEAYATFFEQAVRGAQ